MGFDSLFHYVNLTLEVFLIDVLLSGDNAVMIALACRTLPPTQMRQAMLIGTGIAIVLRILLTTIVSLLLSMPLLKLVGGFTLVMIAIKLIIAQENDPASVENTAEQNADLWSAIGTILIADIVMSVDNVLGLAAVTQGSTLFLVLGVLMSVPLLMYGSLFVCDLLKRHPLLIHAGGALLGWVAGDIAITDPLIADWVNRQAPALTGLVPPLVAVFVLVESRIMQETRPAAVLLRPARRPAPALPTVIKQALIKTFRVLSARFVTTAAPVASPGAMDPPPAPRRHRFVLPAGALRHCAILSLPLLAGIVLFGHASANWLAKPLELKPYLCKEANAVILYRPGGNAIRMRTVSGFNSITGVITKNNIDWDDYASSTKTLGFLPPTAVQYADDQLVRLHGGLYSGTDCRAQSTIL